MMTGFLLARAGVDVVVLEKHADFLRDFRGDTVHPSTLELIAELGLLDEFLRRPHQEMRRLKGIIGKTEINVADFSHLPVRCPFVAFMPQWDFLDFIAQHARSLPSFRLMMETSATGIVEEDGRAVGVIASTKNGSLTVRALLTIGADGRASVIRERAGLQAINMGAPFDVFWMKLPRGPSEQQAPLGRVNAGHILVTIDRGDYWQCGLVIIKGTAEEVRKRGLEAFRERIAATAPELGDSVHALESWDDIRLLTVKVDRLKTWHKPGLLMIGDGAHAMSPIGGVGINLAIQDAVAAANILTRPLKKGNVSADDLQRVQQRREWPTRATQFLQIAIQNQLMARVLTRSGEMRAPLALRLLNRCPLLQRIPARLIGMGFRPEHIAL
jgi:2-polyprenyl-6-methoxyphenol hydroxylase-like FAD-dependent oxidoreductase